MTQPEAEAKPVANHRVTESVQHPESANMKKDLQKKNASNDDLSLSKKYEEAQKRISQENRSKEKLTDSPEHLLDRGRDSGSKERLKTETPPRPPINTSQAHQKSLENSQNSNRHQSPVQAQLVQSQVIQNHSQQAPFQNPRSSQPDISKLSPVQHEKYDDVYESMLMVRMENEKLKLQSENTKTILKDMSKQLKELREDRDLLQQANLNLKKDLKQANEEADDRIRSELKRVEESYENEMEVMRQRVVESESKRLEMLEILKEQQGDWDRKLEAFTEEIGGKWLARVKEAETRARNAEAEAKELKRDCERLREHLSETKRTLEDAESGNDQAMLRKQLDTLLKEKTGLYQENNDLRAQLEISSSPKKILERSETPKSSKRVQEQPANHQASTNVQKVKTHHENLQASLSEEDRDLQAKVLDYFMRRQPGASIGQVNKSK